MTGTGARTAVVALVFTVLVIVVWADPLLTPRNFVGRDLVAYNLPLEKTVHDAYRAGSLPLWQADVSGGRPLAPNPNAGGFYPIRVALAIVPFPFAIKLFRLLHWAAAGIGALVLLRSFGLSLRSAWIGAVTYVFSGVSVSEVFFPHVQPGFTLLPWLVWAVRRPVRSRRSRVLLLSVLLGLDFLAGDVFTAALALAACVLCILLEEPLAERSVRLAELAGGAILGALIAAPQIVATALWTPLTTRAMSGISLAEALTFSLSPLRLIELAIPFPFGATWSLEYARVWGTGPLGGRPCGLHASLYAGAFALMAVWICRRERLGGARLARVLFAICVSLCVLPSFLPRSWAAARSPIALRNPEKFAVGIAFSLALFSGIALERAIGNPRVRRGALTISALLTFAALAVRAAPSVARAAAAALGSGSRAESAGVELPDALAQAAALWLATAGAIALLGVRRKEADRAGLLLLTLVPIAANRRIAPIARNEEIFAPPASVRAVARRDPAGDYRTLGESLYRAPSRVEAFVIESDPLFTAAPRRRWIEHTSAIWGRGTVFNDDFDRGDLARMEWLRRVSFPASRHASGRNFFEVLGLRWGIRYRDQPPLPGYRRFGGDLLQDWDEDADARPDLRLLERWQEETGGIPALNALSRLSGGEVVLETGRRQSGSSRPGRVRVERRASRLRVICDAPDPTWLFVLRNGWPYRIVTLDGRRVRPVPAQIAFTALRIPPGRHLVDWREQLPGGGVSRWGPVLFLVTAAVWTIASRHPKSS